MPSVSRRTAALSTLVSNSLTVGITVVQAFVLIPLCLAHLGPHVYGAWLAAAELLLWVQMLDGGLPNLLMQRVGALAGRDDTRDAATWSSTTLLALLATGVAVGAAAFVSAPFVSDWAQVPPARRGEFVGAFRVSVAAAVLLLWSNGCVGLSRGVQRTSLLNTWQVIGAVAGLTVPIALLTDGWGLWALAAGLLARSALTVAGAVWFLLTLPRGVSWWSQPSFACLREIARLLPSMATANVAYVVANNSEILLVTSVSGPLPALAYALTRRALDGVRNLLDTIAWATSGAFAHLVTADDRHRARTVLAELLWARLALACLAGAVVVAVNEAFVTALFGGQHFGGLLLTVALALQMIVGGQSFLANFLWRSTGPVREGSILLSAESLLRVLGMYAGLLLWGVVGAPLAAVAVSMLALMTIRARLEASLPPPLGQSTSAPGILFPVLAFSLGVAVAAVGIAPSWLNIALTATVVGSCGAFILWLALPTVAAEGTVLRWNRS